MKKINIILICIIIALISGAIGFIIVININGTNIKEKEIIGTYKTNDWNGEEAVIALKKDKTMICPNGNGTWSLEDGKIYIEYDYIDTAVQSAEEYVASFSDEPTLITEKDYTRHVKAEIILVEGGVMLDDHFFEKVNKK